MIGVGPVAVSVQFDGTAVAPVVPLLTTLTRLRVAGWSSLLILQVALTPGVRTRLAPVSVPAVQDQAPAVYPAGPPDSDSVYVPAFTEALVTVAAPVTPLIFVGPAAARVHAVAAAVPPLSFVTVLTSVSFGLMSLLLMVQVALVFSGRTKEDPVRVPAVQDQLLAVYPLGPPDSARV